MHSNLTHPYKNEKDVCMNQTPVGETFNTPNSLLSSDEMHREARVSFLEEQIAELEDICQHVDPAKPLSEELKERLAKFQITEYFDPFIITNKLVVLLEDYIEELHSLQK